MKQIRNRKAKASTTRTILGGVVSVVLLIGAVLLILRSGSGEPYQFQIDKLAKSMQLESEHGCVSWTGIWTYTDNIYSGAIYHPENSTIPTCTQMIVVDRIEISRAITREASFYVIFRKEYNTLAVFDYFLTNGMPVPANVDEITTIVDGLSLLHLSIEDQQEISVSYSGAIFTWDAHSVPWCREFTAVDEMSNRHQINGGGILRIIGMSCGR